VGGLSAGFTLYQEDGFVKAEYNAMTLNRYKVSSAATPPAGDAKIEVIGKARGASYAHQPQVFGILTKDLLPETIN
jgi:hypothetical protein